MQMAHPARLRSAATGNSSEFSGAASTPGQLAHPYIAGDDTDGGAQGRWRSDAGAVFYLSSSGQLMEVAVTRQQPPQIGRPQVLFETGLEMASNIDQYLPSADGSRFLLRRPRGSAGAIELQVIVNWPTLLSQASRQ